MRSSRNFIILVYVLNLFTYHSGRTAVSDSLIRVEVSRAAKPLAAVSLAQGQIKAQADNFRYDPSTATWILTPTCIVSITKIDGRNLRFEGTSARIRASTIERQVRTFSPIDWPNTPIVDLAEALKQDRQGLSYRITWFYSMGPFISSGTALYKRHMNELVEYIVEHDWENGRKLHYLYTHVTDKKIQEMAHDIGTKNGGTFEFVSLLHYGAVRHKIS